MLLLLCLCLSKVGPHCPQRSQQPHCVLLLTPESDSNEGVTWGLLMAAEAAVELLSSTQDMALPEGAGLLSATNPLTSC